MRTGLQPVKVMRVADPPFPRPRAFCRIGRPMSSAQQKSSSMSVGTLIASRPRCRSVSSLGNPAIRACSKIASNGSQAITAPNSRSPFVLNLECPQSTSSTEDPTNHRSSRFPSRLTTSIARYGSNAAPADTALGSAAPGAIEGRTTCECGFPSLGSVCSELATPSLRQAQRISRPHPRHVGDVGGRPPPASHPQIASGVPRLRVGYRGTRTNRRVVQQRL
jgi:hypothetical protein